MLCHFQNSFFKDLQKAPLNNFLILINRYIHINMYNVQILLNQHKIFRKLASFYFLTPKMAKMLKLTMDKYFV